MDRGKVVMQVTPVWQDGVVSVSQITGMELNEFLAECLQGCLYGEPCRITRRRCLFRAEYGGPEAGKEGDRGRCKKKIREKDFR